MVTRNHERATRALLRPWGDVIATIAWTVVYGDWINGNLSGDNWAGEQPTSYDDVVINTPALQL